MSVVRVQELERQVAELQRRLAGATTVDSLDRVEDDVPPTLAYCRGPAIHGNLIAFVTDDDLWIVPCSGGTARRITFGGCVQPPVVFSPDGALLAVTCNLAGVQEVYTVPTQGGRLSRITHLSSESYPCCWEPSGTHIIISSSAQQALCGRRGLFRAALSGGEVLPLNLGDADTLSIHGDVRLLGRHTMDPVLENWKDYKGGKVGQAWRGEHKKWLRLPLQGNIGFPCLLSNGRVAYTADPGGQGAVYIEGEAVYPSSSVHPPRYLSCDEKGERLVWQLGGDVVLDGVPVCIHVPSIRQRLSLPRVVAAEEWLENLALHPRGHHFCFTTRGQLFEAPLWHGPAVQFGVQGGGVRYRMPCYMHSGWIAVSSDNGGEWRLELYRSSSLGKENDTGGCIEGAHSSSAAEPLLATLPDNITIGEVREVSPCPKRDALALLNHRNELLLLEFAGHSGRCKAKVLDVSEREFGLSGVTWSPCGEWLAYSASCGDKASTIKVCQCHGEYAVHQLTSPGCFEDTTPSFDQRGMYLAFLSNRGFIPKEDSVQFSLSFRASHRPHLMLLKKDTPHPLKPLPEAPGTDSDEESEEEEDEEEEDENPKKENKDNKDTDKFASERDVESAIVIDIQGIHRRVVALPLPRGKYEQLTFINNGRDLIYTRFPLISNTDDNSDSDDDEDEEDIGSLYKFHLKSQKEQELADDVEEYNVSADGDTTLIHTQEDDGGRVRVFQTGTKVASEDSDDEAVDMDKPGKESGLVEMDSRVPVCVDTSAEWGQIFREAWRGLRDHFYDEKMRGVDWVYVREECEKLLPRVSTRNELTDLIREMACHLGCSHLYVDPPPGDEDDEVAQGFLGADYEFEDGVGWRITSLLEGDPWDPHSCGPLATPGLNINVGDVITAINRRDLTKKNPTIHDTLAHKAGIEIFLTVSTKTLKKKKKKKKVAVWKSRTVRVRACAEKVESAARYRDWVENNKLKVHQATENKVGYVHTPDTEHYGYTEFHRYYLAECEKEAIIIDARGNQGGYASELLLEKLMRRPIGYSVPRKGRGVPQSYPQHALRAGKIIMLTDEHTGSDGDILSHAFQTLQLGMLVGHQTWGGVLSVGVHDTELVDGGESSVPCEGFFALHEGIGDSLENKGVTPDIPVIALPGDKFDRQLDVAIQEVLKLVDVKEKEKEKEEEKEEEEEEKKD